MSILKGEEKISFIDITPTWAATTIALILIIENGDEEGKAFAKEELLKMAKLADLYAASKKDGAGNA